MLTIISGTNRPGSHTRQVVRHIEGIYKQLGEPLTLIDLAELPAEIFHASTYTHKPASFTPFVDKVLRAWGLVVVAPDYNGGMPGVLKYFLDLLPFPNSLRRRPACFVGLSAGPWEALMPVEQLEAIFAYRQAFLYSERVVIPNCNAVITAGGELTDAGLGKHLFDQASGFIKFVQTLRALD